MSAAVEARNNARYDSRVDVLCVYLTMKSGYLVKPELSH